MLNQPKPNTKPILPLYCVPIFRNFGLLFLKDKTTDYFYQCCKYLEQNLLIKCLNKKAIKLFLLGYFFLSLKTRYWFETIKSAKHFINLGYLHLIRTIPSRTDSMLGIFIGWNIGWPSKFLFHKLSSFSPR